MIFKNFLYSAAALLSCALFSARPACAGSFIFTGPSLSIIGEPILFDIFSAQLTSPSAGNWQLVINTNYGGTIPIPPGNAIPTFLVGGNTNYNLGDFLFVWQGNDYGIDFFGHDGYTPGDLYSVPSFLTSQQVLAEQGALPFSTGYLPVEIGTGGTQIGTGSFSVAATGDGTSSGLYTITENFSAPSNFLSDNNFMIYMSSAICANGIIIGDSTDAAVPEPGTWALCASAALLLLLSRRFRRSVMTHFQVRQEPGQNSDRG